MNLAMSLFVRLDATSMVTANWRGVSTSMRESSFSVPLGRMLLCHHWLEVSVAGLIGWVWTSWAFALGGCLISFPVDRLGAVLYRLLYFFFAMPTGCHKRACGFQTAPLPVIASAGIRWVCLVTISPNPGPHQSSNDGERRPKERKSQPVFVMRSKSITRNTPPLRDGDACELTSRRTPLIKVKCRLSAGGVSVNTARDSVSF